jgi:hypothetical protein
MCYFSVCLIPMHIPLVSPWTRYSIDIPNYESPDVPTRCYIWWFYLLGGLSERSPFKPVHYFRGNSLITECLGDGVLFLLPLQYTRNVEVLNITAYVVLVHIEGHSSRRGILCVLGCLCRVRLVIVLFRFLCFFLFLWYHRRFINREEKSSASSSDISGLVSTYPAS